MEKNTDFRVDYINMDLQKTTKIKKLGGNRKHRKDDEYRRMTNDKKHKYDLVELNVMADNVEK